MKNLILSTIATAFVMVSCNQKNKEAVTPDPKENQNQSNAKEAADKSNFSINEITTNYLHLKNALVNDDSKNAANAGKELLTAFNNINSAAIDEKLKIKYNDIADVAKEHAEHIGDNDGNIEHQREHFVLLSKDVNDLIEEFGTDQKLYQDFCPMTNDGKGAIWISETKEIKNPYYGSKMSSCGSIKKTL